MEEVTLTCLETLKAGGNQKHRKLGQHGLDKVSLALTIPLLSLEVGHSITDVLRYMSHCYLVQGGTQHLCAALLPQSALFKRMVLFGFYHLLVTLGHPLINYPHNVAIDSSLTLCQAQILPSCEKNTRENTCCLLYHL